MKILLVDNFDSFTYNLSDYLRSLGAIVEVHRSNHLPWSDILSFHAIVLSPGPGHPSEHFEMMKLIDLYYDQLPFLGICLGHQALGLYFGLKLHCAAQPCHGKVSLISHQEEGIFEGIKPPTQVMRYHSLVLEEMKDKSELHYLAHSSQGELMAFKHKRYDIWGIQFHPESILTLMGKNILANWLKLIEVNNFKRRNN